MQAPAIFLPTASTHQQLSNSPTAVSEMPALPGRSGKIQPWHLERLAIVYVRQSSQYQVVHNKESAEVQSAFRNLAMAWGWPSSRVIVIDHDQAQVAQPRGGSHRVSMDLDRGEPQSRRDYSWFPG